MLFNIDPSKSIFPSLKIIVILQTNVFNLKIIDLDFFKIALFTAFLVFVRSVLHFVRI